MCEEVTRFLRSVIAAIHDACHQQILFESSVQIHGNLSVRIDNKNSGTIVVDETIYKGSGKSKLNNGDRSRKSRVTRLKSSRAKNVSGVCLKVNEHVPDGSGTYLTHALPPTVITSVSTESACNQAEGVISTGGNPEDMNIKGDVNGDLTNLNKRESYDANFKLRRSKNPAYKSEKIETNNCSPPIGDDTSHGDGCKAVNMMDNDLITSKTVSHPGTEDASVYCFLCNVCQKKFRSQRGLKDHKIAEHLAILPYTCELCNVAFKFQNSLRMHKLSKHSTLRPHTCNECDKTFLTISHLNTHIDAVHLELKKFACRYCSRSFAYKNSCDQHERVHRGDRRFECAKCDRRFITSSALKVHQSSHSSAKTAQCTTCGKFYKNPVLLRLHARRHTNAGIICDVCGQTFLHRSALLIHASTHKTTREFVCKTCGKAFKTQATLYSHQAVHSIASPFSCSICEKTFKTKQRLRAHEQRHSDTKTYKCQDCGKMFSAKGDLSKHARTLHSIKHCFVCNVCGKESTRADNLRVHMSRVHGYDPKELTLEKLLDMSEKMRGGNSRSTLNNQADTLGNTGVNGVKTNWQAVLSNSSQESGAFDNGHVSQSKLALNQTLTHTETTMPSLKHIDISTHSEQQVSTDSRCITSNQYGKVGSKLDPKSSHNDISHMAPSLPSQHDGLLLETYFHPVDIATNNVSFGIECNDNEPKSTTSDSHRCIPQSVMFPSGSDDFPTSTPATISPASFMMTEPFHFANIDVSQVVEMSRLYPYLYGIKPPS